MILQKDTRIHYMDNLRAFAMLLGVFFHAALAYSPLVQQVWLTADVGKSAALDYAAFLSHIFRMPLFFLIAGFFACLLYEKRGLRKLLSNRVKRVALPFVIFLPLVTASLIMSIGWAIEVVEQKSFMLSLIENMIANPGDNKPPPSTTHLWFLYYLIFFYLVTVLLLKLIKKDLGRYIFISPKVFLLLAPLVLIPALIKLPAPLPAPERFYPELWSFGYFGMFFGFGWLLYKRQTFIDQLEPYAWWLLGVGIIAYSVYHSMLPETIVLKESMMTGNYDVELSLRQLFFALLAAISSVYLTLAILLLGRKFFDRQNRAIRLVADSSYWIYIIHLPIVMFIQFALLDVNWLWQIEFLLSSTATIILGFVTYLLLVRWTPIGWLLNGRKF